MDVADLGRVRRRSGSVTPTLRWALPLQAQDRRELLGQDGPATVSRRAGPADRLSCGRDKTLKQNNHVKNGRLRDEQSACAIGPETAENDPEDSISRSELGSRLRAQSDHELLPQRGVLEDQVRPRPHDGPTQGEMRRIRAGPSSGNHRCGGGVTGFRGLRHLSWVPWRLRQDYQYVVDHRERSALAYGGHPKIAAFFPLNFFPSLPSATPSGGNDEQNLYRPMSSTACTVPSDVSTSRS